MARVKEALMDACERVIDKASLVDDDLNGYYEAHDLFADVIGEYYGNMPSSVLAVAKEDEMLAAYIPADAKHDD